MTSDYVPIKTPFYWGSVKHGEVFFGEPIATKSKQDAMEAMGHANRTLHEAMRCGNLRTYVAPEGGQALSVPRYYWNQVDPENIHHIFKGMSKSDLGTGCPILIPRPEFEAWRISLTSQNSSQPKRAPAFKAGRPPSEEAILEKAHEMKARGLTGRQLASQMRYEAGFENVGTTHVRDLIRGLWSNSGRPKHKGA